MPRIILIRHIYSFYVYYLQWHAYVADQSYRSKNNGFTSHSNLLLMRAFNIQSWIYQRLDILPRFSIKYDISDLLRVNFIVLTPMTSQHTTRALNKLTQTTYSLPNHNVYIYRKFSSLVILNLPVNNVGH